MGGREERVGGRRGWEGGEGGREGGEERIVRERERTCT